MNNWKPSWLARIATVALAISIFAACSDSTAPTGGDLDPVAAQQALDQVNNQFFENNEAVQSLSFFGDFMIGSLGTDVTAFDLLPFAKADRLESIPTALRLSVAEGSLDSPQRIPVGALGKTFVYNTGTSQYEIDAERTDAPANGVRFVLYAVDPILEEPVDPLVEVGHIDIIDTSNFPTVNISLEAVITSVGTVMDLDVSGTMSETNLNIDFSGTLSDGSENLGFTLALDATETSLATDFDFSTSGFNVSMSLTGSEESDGSIEFDITDGTNILSFDLVVVGGVIQNGSGVVLGTQQVAIISGTIDDPIVTNGAGDPLNADELNALAELFLGLEDMFEFFLGMVNFGLFLIILGLI